MPEVLRKLKFCLHCFLPSSLESERCFSSTRMFVFTWPWVKN